MQLNGNIEMGLSAQHLSPSLSNEDAAADFAELSPVMFFFAVLCFFVS